MVLLKTKESELRVRIHGELGNQMFQLAAALFIGDGRPITGLIDHNVVNRLTFFKLPHNIKFESQKLSRGETFLTRVLNARSKVKLIRFPAAVIIRTIYAFEKFKRLFRNGLPEGIHSSFQKSSNGRFVEKVAFSFQFPTDPNSITFMDGYFQSWKYVYPNRGLLRVIFKETLSLSDDTVKVRESLPTKFTAVHVRRGNSGAAVLNSDFHGLLPLDYYNRALSLLRELKSLYPIVVFTDNKPLTSQLFSSEKFQYEILRIISPEDVANQVQNLYLMSESSSFVGANSSYSWWAAELSEETSIKIFPRPWIKSPGFSEQDLLYPSWITVGFERFH